jgi:ribosomal protein L13E
MTKISRRRKTYLEGDVELPREIIDTIIKCETGDHTPHLRVGQG